MGRQSNREKLVKRLKEKSIEALLLGIELYNKPTISYRTESTAFLICNAWELILKAQRIHISGEKSIYRKKDNKSFSLEEMVNIEFNNNSPIKKNLDYIIKNIRNVSTHFIIREYDNLYSPLLQQCILNYVDYLNAKFKTNLADIMPSENLALVIRHDKTNKKLNKIYGKDFSKHYFDAKNQLINFIEENTNNDKCPVIAFVENKLSFVKNPDSADILAFYDTSGVGLNKISVAKDVNLSHPYSMKQAINNIKKFAQKSNFDISGLHCNSLVKYNKDNNIYAKPELYNEINYGNGIIKKYSDAYIDLILTSITKNPTIFANKKNHPSSE